MNLLKLIALSLPLAVASIACTSEDVSDDLSDEAGPEIQHLTAAQKEAAKATCSKIRPHAFTSREQRAIMDRTVQKIADRKRLNDRLIRERGVGMFAGFRTEAGKAIMANRREDVAANIRGKVKAGFSAQQIANEMRTTSCIDMVVDVLGEVYRELGLDGDWKTVRDCARAWDLDGLHLQQALMANGWPSPTLPFFNDTENIVGMDAAEGTKERVDADTHYWFGIGQKRQGTYFGTPVSKTLMMKNFLPTPGSDTPVDRSVFLRLGKSRMLTIGTMRGAYHVPIVVPASVIADEFAPAERNARLRFQAAKRAGEPFVMESHSLRNPWDATNFEIRPMTDVINETYAPGETVHYATGTLLFAPGSDFDVPR